MLSLNATTQGPGNHYSIIRELFKNQHYSECAMLGEKILIEYPDFFKNDWISLFTAISLYKTGYKEEGLKRLSQMPQLYKKSPATKNAKLILSLLNIRQKNEPIEFDEHPLTQKIVSELSVSQSTLEEYYKIDTQSLLNGDLPSKKCDSLRQVLIDKGKISFVEDQLPFVLSLIRYGAKHNNKEIDLQLHITSFIAVLLAEQSDVPLPLPKPSLLNKIKRLKRLSEDDSKVSQEVKELYKMID